MRFDLSDEEWALLEPLLPKSRKSARVDDRKIVNAIFYVDCMVVTTGANQFTASAAFQRYRPKEKRHS